jgi:hypothetical protein
LVDASDDAPIGFLLLTAQMLLQEQRDDAIERFSFFMHSLPNEKRRIVRELRRFAKPGSPKEYFPVTGQRSAGAVIGLIELDVLLEEDLASLYGANPYSCPARPKDGLDLATIKFHIQRISHLFDEVKAMLNGLGYVTSWENPPLTLVSFLVFATFCFKVHPDYFFSGPVFLVICYQGYLAYWRFNGGLLRKFQTDELAANKKMTRVSVDYTLHRPVGLVRTMILGGRNIRSPELGLSGSVSCRVSIDLAMFCDEKEREKLLRVEGAAGARHNIGSTESLFSTSPKWKLLEESDESKRIKQLIPNQEDYFERTGMKNQTVSALEFPILQPIAQGSHQKEVELRPWPASTAAVVFEVMFHDITSVRVIPGAEYSLGEAIVPLSKLVQEGEIEDWFTLSHGPDTGFAPTSALSHLTDRPAIKLNIKWLPPSNVDDLPAEVEREASIVIQEELCRSVAHAQKKQASLIGSSLGAIDSFRGVSNYLLAIQNGLGAVLDVIEGTKNLFNFTDPAKSLLVVSITFFVWAVLYLVPFRLMVFTVGSLRYILALKPRLTLFNRPKRKTSFPDKDHHARKPSVVAVWVNNFIRSLPVDEDIRRTYFWETQRKVAKQVRETADERRSSRLQKLWRSQWNEHVILLQRPSDSKLPPKLEPAFAVLQGRRFMIWKSAVDFDDGESPTIKLFLRGHAGLSNPSPIELKTIGKEVDSAISVFGRGTSGQERITILTSGIKSKEALESAVLVALNTKDD